ncbi:MAG: polyprenyl synthetase family protein [Nocardioidaceae bacterium]
MNGAAAEPGIGVDPSGGPVVAGFAGRLLAETRELIEPALLAAIDDLPPRVRLVAGYHAGLWDAHGRPAGRPGKALRPALVLSCGRAAAGAEDTGTSDRLTTAAVAVELMHDFTLLHDDVMDGDTVRRHRPAAWDVFGVAYAVLAGDTLLALALSQLSRLGAGMETLTATYLELCLGQGTDLEFQGRAEDADLGRCLTLAEAKTGALLGCACQLGAMAMRAGAWETAQYREFGRHLGVAFQLTDDLLGIWGDPALTGKPVHADLATRKLTLPVAAALTSGTSAGEKLRALYAAGDLSSGRPVERENRQWRSSDRLGLDTARMADLVEQAGGRAWAQTEADRRAGRALDALARARPEPGAAAELRALVELARRRDL